MFIKAHLIEVSSFGEVTNVESNWTGINFITCVKTYTSKKVTFPAHLKDKISCMPSFSTFQRHVDFETATRIELTNGETIFALENFNYFDTALS